MPCSSRQVKLVIKSTGHFFFRFSASSASVDDYHWTILDSAAYSGSNALVEVVLAKISNKLDADEVCTKVSYISYVAVVPP